MKKLRYNWQFQASQLGLGTQWSEIKKKYIEANLLVRARFMSFSILLDRSDSAAISSKSHPRPR